VAVNGARIALTDEVTPLNVNAVGDVTPGQSILVTNRSAITIDIGGEDVVTGEGYPVDAGDSFSATLEHGEIVYAVAPDAGPYEVSVFQSGVV
jgi:hypothetical protein